MQQMKYLLPIMTKELNPEETLQMTSGSIPLVLKTTGTAYDEDKYIVEWSFFR